MKFIIAALMTVFLMCFSGTTATEAYADEVDTSVSVYRLWHPLTGEHFYTSDKGEADYLEQNTYWVTEGIGFKTPQTGDPVYRLYNPNSGEHFYTLSADEKNFLSSVGWNFEGSPFYSVGEDQGYPVYRLYSGSGHLWTLDETEYNYLSTVGWVQEGIAWYATGLAEFYPEDQRKKPVTWEDVYAAEWAPRIDAYNAGWPLAGYGDAFARAAYRNGMDPRTAPAIARIESGSGRVPLYRYGAGNCWGWMSYLSDDFGSSIYLFCEKFSRSYGSTLTYNGAVRYAGYGNYYYTVQREMNKI